MEDLQNYIRRLSNDNLVVARRLGDGGRLFQQYQREQAGLIPKMLTGLLSIRLPGIYPGVLLAVLRPLGWLAFNSVSKIAFFVFVTVTLAFVGLSIDTIVQKSPSLVSLITPEHLFLMLVAFVVAKVFHELGHALACQYTGHECTEMGVMLLVFTPCLYCDVSDMWTENCRWKRIFVSLAGVWVELTIAALCFWGWYFTVDGVLNRFLFGMMLMTSINTVFINGNPLMRYDGYYALSDLVGIPNLAGRARQHVGGLIQEFFTHRTTNSGLERHHRFLTAYGIGSFVYRWFILIAICWGIWTFFDSLQLGALGRMVISVVVLSSLIPLAMSIPKHLHTALSGSLRIVNVLILAGLFALVLAGVFRIEFAHRIWGPATIQLSQPTEVFSSSDGFFTSAIDDLDPVESGQLLATISDEDLVAEKVKVQAQMLDVRAQLESLDRMQGTTESASEIEFLKKRLSTLVSKLGELEQQRKLLEIRAPVEGKFVAWQNTASRRDDDITKYEGSAFDKQNRGCFVHRGAVLGYIGAPDSLTGYLEVDESDVELIRVGQFVRLLSPQSSLPCEAVVTKIALEPHTPARHGEDENDSNLLELHGVYMVEFEFESDPRFRPGSVHRAVVMANSTTLAQYLQRWWQNSLWY